MICLCMMSDAVKGLRQKEKHCSTFYFQDHQVGHVGREPPVKPTVAKEFTLIARNPLSNGPCI